MAATGITYRHSRSCRKKAGGRCNCKGKGSWEAWVWLNRENRKVSKSFPTEAAAKAWRADAEGAKNRNALRAPTQTTVAEAAAAFMEGAESGAILNRKGERYKPATLRSYRRALRDYVLPALGPMKLTEVQRQDIEREVVKPMRAAGKAASTQWNVLDPLRCVFREAIHEVVVAADPCEGLRLGKTAKRELHLPSVEEVQALLAALPEEKQALWATAMYAGLRHGELRALRVSDIDFAKGLIRVRRGWDDVEGEQAPKTEKAKRDVVLLDPLLPVLRGHIVREGRRGSDLVFGEAPDKPLPSATERRRAQAAWRAENERRARRGEDPLTPLGFHDCRHAFASVLIASNANPLQIQTQMGHASIGETYGTYGHHFRDSVEDLRARANAFLAGDERRALRVVGG